MFVFWQNRPELPWVSGKHGESALQEMGWSACVPKNSPSQRAKLCTYFAWFLRPVQLQIVPFIELPMPISRLQLLMQCRIRSHALPVEQGRLSRPAIPRHLRRCTLCEVREFGDERHFVFDCPHFAHICGPGCDRALKVGGASPVPGRPLPGPAPGICPKVLQDVRFCRGRPSTASAMPGGWSVPAGFFLGCHTLLRTVSFIVSGC